MQLSSGILKAHYHQTLKNKKKLKAVIIIHESTTGPGHDLRDYLLARGVSTVLFIAHPLLYITANFKNASRYELYKNGKLVEKNSGPYVNFPEYILYVKDMLFSLYWIVKHVGVHDVFVGVGNLDAFVGILLQFFGIAKTTIFYVIDYVPQRFANNAVNYVYHWIEKMAAVHSDWTWNLSPRMIEAREKKWKRKFPHQLVVPHGVHYDRIHRVPYAKVNMHEIIFMGSILKKQGVQLVIEALSIIKKEIPDISLTIIGDGPYRPELEKLTTKLNLNSRVSFAGYVEDHRDVENRIAKAGLAVALYNKADDDFTYYADPGKIRNYLGAGVPVLLTDVPYVAHEVEKRKCGKIVSYDVHDIARTVVALLKNEKTLKEYRENARTFAKSFQWEQVFSHALSRLDLLQ